MISKFLSAPPRQGLEKKREELRAQKEEETRSKNDAGYMHLVKIRLTYQLCDWPLIKSYLRDLSLDTIVTRRCRVQICVPSWGRAFGRVCEQVRRRRRLRRRRRIVPASPLLPPPPPPLPPPVANRTVAAPITAVGATSAAATDADAHVDLAVI